MTSFWPTNLILKQITGVFTFSVIYKRVYCIQLSGMYTLDYEIYKPIPKVFVSFTMK